MEERKSRFKAASLTVNKQVADEAKEKVRSGRSGRTGYHSIDDGKNIFRIAPPHEEGNPSLEPMCKVWLPREVEVEGKSGKKITEIKDYPIFNSKVHSPIGKDIVEEYVAFATKVTNAEYNKEDAKRKLAPITGFRDKQGKWIRGIMPSLSFVCYAWKEGEFGRLELYKTVVDKMNDLAIDEESDESIAVDPFSDPNEGVSLIITLEDRVYKVSKGSRKSALTEEQEDELSAAEPLADLFRNAFTKEDFSHQLESLRIFDAQHKFGFMDMEEFIKICENIADLIDNCPDIRDSNRREEDTDDEPQAKKETPKREPVANQGTAKPIIKKEEAREEAKPVDDGLDDLDMDELKEYIAEQGLNVEVKPAYTKSKVIRDIRAAVAGTGGEEPVDDLPFDKAAGETVKTAANVPTGTASEKLAEMRRRREGK